VSERPLVVVTRDERGNGRLASALETRGLATLSLPTVAVVPGPELPRLDALLSELSASDWLVFTSAHAVEVVRERPAWHALAGRRPRLGVVGAATAGPLREGGVTVDVVAAGPGARSLADALALQGDLAGAHVVWPRSSLARRELAEWLREGGARVSEAVVYSIEPVASAALGEFRELLGAGRLAALTFLSPSSAHGLAAALGWGDLALLAGRVLVASIGPTTSAALRELQAPPQLESAQPGIEALADSLAAQLIGAKR
jgi:uroporphyrinogen-III synthase